jgi:hypothetical protein
MIWIYVNKVSENIFYSFKCSMPHLFYDWEYQEGQSIEGGYTIRNREATVGLNALPLVRIWYPTKITNICGLIKLRISNTSIEMGHP